MAVLESAMQRVCASSPGSLVLSSLDIKRSPQLAVQLSCHLQQQRLPAAGAAAGTAGAATAAAATTTAAL